MVKRTEKIASLFASKKKYDEKKRAEKLQAEQEAAQVAAEDAPPTPPPAAMNYDESQPSTSAMYYDCQPSTSFTVKSFYGATRSVPKYCPREEDSPSFEGFDSDDAACGWTADDLRSSDYMPYDVDMDRLQLSEDAEGDDTRDDGLDDGRGGARKKTRPDKLAIRRELVSTSAT